MGDNYIKEIEKLLSKLEQKITEFKKSKIDTYKVCWNCNHFSHIKYNSLNKSTGKCELHNVEVSDAKWQKCENYDICKSFK